MTDEPLTFDTIAQTLSAGGVSFTRLDRGTDREGIEIPAYGLIWYDDGRQTENPGWVVDDQYSGSGKALTEHELRSEISSLCRWAEAIR